MPVIELADVNVCFACPKMPHILLQPYCMIHEKKIVEFGEQVDRNGAHYYVDEFRDSADSNGYSHVDNCRENAVIIIME